MMFKLTWNKYNKHNYTYSNSLFPIDKVHVGMMTYGELNVYSYYNDKESLTIGSYVSIAHNVQFILGGNHQTKTISNYPLFSMLIGNNPSLDADTKGGIIVEDCVWIGCNTTILSGVTVGKGSIIAAGSVVHKNVPPYTLVGGNPAQIIKSLFSEDIVKKLYDVDFSSLAKDKLISSIDLLYSKIDSIDQVDKLFEVLQNNNR